MITEEIRSYEVSVWTLQDSFVTVLKWSNVEQKGRIEDPILTLNIDGTQTFEFSIPMYYYDQGKFVDNPNWYSTQNGNIIANLRKIKVIFNKRTEDEEVFEFLIISTEESHEKDVAECKVKCEGLAFHELGKIGYKYALSQELFELDYEKWVEDGSVGEEPIQSVDYWCNKIELDKFPVTGNEINDTILEEHWNEVNPNQWYYKIEMNQDSFISTSDTTKKRLTDKVYEDVYPNAWDEHLNPIHFVVNQEKARPISIENSNIYNITQTIAESFEIYCKYKYYYNESYQIIAKVVIFYNNFYADENQAFSLVYPYSSSKIIRRIDSTNLATKLYVLAVDNDATISGMNTIMNADCNLSHEDYILNFDYLYQSEIISKDQYDAINPYLSNMRTYNEQLIKYQRNKDTYAIQKAEAEAKISIYEKSIDLDTEEITRNEALRNALDIKDEVDGYITVDANNPDYRLINTDKDGKYYISLDTTNKGICTDTIKIYRKESYNAANHTFATNSELSGYTFEEDEYNNPHKIYGIAPTTGNNASYAVYLTYKYSPKLYYDRIVKVWIEKLNQDTANLEKEREFLTALNTQITTAEAAYNEILADKQTAIREFNYLMGPALREGYWQPEDYRDYGKSYHETQELEADNDLTIDTYNSYVVGWDSELFDEEDKNYYEEGVLLNKIYYPCIDLSQEYNGTPIYELIKNDINDYCFIFNNNYVSSTDNNNNPISATDTRYTQYFAIGSKALLQFGEKDGQICPLLILVGAKSLSDGTEEYNSIDEIEFITHDTVVRNGQTVPGGRPRLGKIISREDNDGNGSYEIADDPSPIPVADYFVDGSDYQTVYPRIKFSSLDLRTADSDFHILYEGEQLSVAQDYRINTRNTERDEDYYSEYYITIDPDVLYKAATFSGTFDVYYMLSSANTQIYLDALNVSRENAFPKVEYEVEPNILNRKLSSTLYNKLASLVMINDTSLKLWDAFGYISQVELDLDNVTKDKVEVKNYKNKFEDLFSTIVAQSEEMKRYGGEFRAAGEGKVSMTEETIIDTITEHQSILDNYLDSYFFGSERVKEKLTELFTEAGEILADSNKSLNQVRSLTLENASILSGFASNIAADLTTKVFQQPTKPEQYKPGDIWIDNEGNRYVATSYSNEGVAGATSGFVKTHEGTLASITGAKMSVDTQKGLIDIYAQHEVKLRSGEHVYISAGDTVDIIGNQAVNIGGGTINIAGDATESYASGGINLVSSGINFKPTSSQSSVETQINNAVTSTDTNITKVLIRPNKIEMGSADIIMRGPNKIQMITSRGSVSSTNAISLSPDGVWIGSGNGVRLYSGNIALTQQSDGTFNIASGVGASAEFLPGHILFGVSNTTGATTAIEMTDTYIVMGAGNVINGSNASTKIANGITGQSNGLIGAKFTKNSIGFATGSDDNISAILMNDKGITIGSGSIDVTQTTTNLRQAQNGSYVRIAADGVDIGSTATLTVNMTNFKLQTDPTVGGLGTRLAIGKNLNNIDANTVDGIKGDSQEAFVGLVYNSHGLFISGNLNAAAGTFTGTVYASDGSFTGAVHASSFELVANSSAVTDFNTAVAGTSTYTLANTASTAIAPLTTYGLIGRDTSKSGNTEGSITYDSNGWPTYNNSTYGLILGNSTSYPMLIGSNSGLRIIGATVVTGTTKYPLIDLNYEHVLVGQFSLNNDGTVDTSNFSGLKIETNNNSSNKTDITISSDSLLKIQSPTFKVDNTPNALKFYLADSQYWTSADIPEPVPQGAKVATAGISFEQTQVNNNTVSSLKIKAREIDINGDSNDRSGSKLNMEGGQVIIRGDSGRLSFSPYIILYEQTTLPTNAPLGTIAELIQSNDENYPVGFYIYYEDAETNIPNWYPIELENGYEWYQTGTTILTTEAGQALRNRLSNTPFIVSDTGELTCRQIICLDDIYCFGKIHYIDLEKLSSSSGTGSVVSSTSYILQSIPTS